MGHKQPTESRGAVLAHLGAPYIVRIRRDIGRQVRPEAEAIDGKVFVFRFGWLMNSDDPYPGEDAMIPNDFDWPLDAPTWVAAGDLVAVL